MSGRKKLISAAGAVASGGGAGGNVEDLFSTYLYDGNGSTQTITNGIDLDGEGGMVWFKIRSATTSHQIYDTERGVTKVLFTDATNAESSYPTGLTAFNSDGFSLSSGVGVNGSTHNYVSWTFRKAPKFFDVVTYTGTGSAQSISHNLGSVPAFIVIKRLDATAHWITWHHDYPDNYMLLSTNYANQPSGRTVFSSEDSNSFTLSSNANVNASGGEFVAYLFAHNDDDGEFGPNGNQDIIKCGSYTGTGNGGHVVNIGFEPQWILIKNTDTFDNWILMDTSRGFVDDPTQSYELRPNSAAYGISGSQVSPTSNGIMLTGNGTSYNSSGSNYIYIAIRRGPMAVPTSGTDVLDFLTWSGDNTSNRILTGVSFPHDVAILSVDNPRNFEHGIYSRITGDEVSDMGSIQRSDGWNQTHIKVIHRQDGLELPSNAYNWNSVYYNHIGYFLKRAPEFFDVITYTGNGGNNTINHNLGTTPNMIWIKRRDQAEEWLVWHDGIHIISGETDYLRLHTNDIDTAFGASYMDVGSTSISFTGGYGPTNTTNGKYTGYLFSTLSGVSKVGSYTGNGTNQNVDCGFSSGARFIFIKCTDNYATNPSSLNWYLFDSERGIVANAADTYSITNFPDTDWKQQNAIDPYSSGFNVYQDVNTNLNLNGLKYVFLAIA